MNKVPTYREFLTNLGWSKFADQLDYADNPIDQDFLDALAGALGGVLESDNLGQYLIYTGLTEDDDAAFGLKVFE